MKKRLLLMLVMMLCLLALGIGIAPAEEITVSAPAPEFETVEDGLSAKDAFEGYILQAFGQPPARRVLLKATRQLTGSNKLLYDHLVEIVKDVAAGNRSSTLCQIPLSEFGIKTSYTLEELGFTSLVDEAWDAFWDKVYEELALDLSLIGNKLRADFPYEMYWASSYRRTSGGLPSAWSSSNRIFFKDDAVFEYPIYVSAAYSVSGADQTTDFDTSRAEAVQQAAANAKAIVARYANASSDYGKLRGFKNAICDLVDYNHEAADNNSTPYGDPWQLVWVFDGDPSTKVVCEGYSKAFKYLCDMSSFAEASASIVTGWMSGGTGAGAHMWNIVSMDGVNYLVDVTNCDNDSVTGSISIGYPDYLFMAGYSDTSVNSDGTWYIYRAGQNSISYLYDAEFANLYAAEDLAITTASHEAKPYILSSAEIIELGESVTLTMSVPEVDEDSFAIFYEQNGISHEIEDITPSYVQNEMSLDFTPGSAGEYVFYAGYYDAAKDKQLTDASVRVTVTAPAPDPLTVITEGVIGTDVTIQVVKQEGWNNLSLDIEYLPEGDNADFINWTSDVSDSFTIIGTNFLKPGTYRAVLYRPGETSEGYTDLENPESVASVEFQMADQTLSTTQGVLSAEEITVGDELTFTCPGAEALACHLRMTDPVTGDDIGGTNPPISPSVQGDTLTINYQNTAGILKGYIWAKEAGLWKQPQEIRVTVNVAQPSDETNSLTLNVPKQVTVEDDSGVWLSFTPQETGVYIICSEADDSIDPYVRFCDSEKNNLDEADDYGDYNFRLEYSMTAGQQYYYCVNAYSRPSSFTVRLMKFSGLEASAVDQTYHTVEYGSSAVLEVKAVSDTSEAITYQWLKDGQAIDGATGPVYETPAITVPAAKYICQVNDGTMTVFVRFTVTFDNHLEVAAVPEAEEWSATIDVSAGEPARMEVSASCLLGELHYTWYDNTDFVEIPSVEGQPWVCIVSDYPEDSRTDYLCDIQDDYGNCRTVWFTVYSDNHLQANPVGGSSHKVLPYGDIDLEVEASCTSGSLTYQWQKMNDDYDYIDISGETNPVLQLKNVDWPDTYYCLVRDEFGHEAYADFSVTIDNDFSVKAAEGAIYNVIPGDDLTVEVIAHCREGELHYTWQTYDYDTDEYVVLQEGGSSYTKKNLTEFTEFNCFVHDDFGNSSGVKYEVYVNHLIQPASATRFNLDWRGAAQLSVKVAADCPYPADQLEFRWSCSYNGRNWFKLEADNRAASYATWALDQNMIFRCQASYDDGEDVYEYEYVYFYVNVAPMPATPSDLIISPAGEKTDLNMYFGAEGADVSTAIETFTVEDLEEAQEHLSGEPEWTVERKAGTAEAQVAWDGNTAFLSVVSFPDEAEEAVYTVKCAWDTNLWEEQYTVHYLNLADDQPEGIVLTSGRQTLSAKVGDTLNPNDLFCFTNGWLPAGGEEVRISLQSSGLDINGETGLAAVLNTGSFPVEAALSFANIRYTGSFMLDALDSDGAIPLALNVPQQVTVEDDGGVWLSFTPQETGVYIICSEADDSIDPYVEFCDSEKNGLATADDYEGDLNFRLEYALTAGQKYYCCVKAYSQPSSFTVWLMKPSGLEAYAVGRTYQTVEYGASTVLEVEATSDTPETITYQWLKDGEIIEGAVSSRLEIPSVTDPRSTYTCRVSDGSMTVPVYFDVAFDNHLYVSADPDRQVWEGSIDVENGAPARMQVYASCAHGDLHYTWFNGDTNEIVPGSGDASICEATDYKDNSQTYYYCQISDEYGNSESIWFTVYSDNHLQADPVGGYYHKVLPYGDIDLEVEASCTSGSLTYQWQKTNDDNVFVDMPGETNPVLQLKKVDRADTYICIVRDKFGHEASAYFKLNIENELSIEAVGGTVYNVVPGDDLTVEVITHHMEGNLHISWRKYNSETEEVGILLQDGGSSHTEKNLTEDTEFCCFVEDDFRNSLIVLYQVHVNHLIQPASATRFNLDWGGTAQMSVKVDADCPYPADQLEFCWYGSFGGGWFEVQADNQASSYATWALDRSMVFRCKASYDEEDGEEDDYEYEYVYFYVNVAPRHATPGDLIISPVSGKTDQNMYFGAEGADISSDIDAFTVDNLAEVKEYQSGKPKWTVETVRGTTAAKVAFDGQKASLKVQSFPKAAEDAKYRVKCVWGKSTWEQEIIVHYRDLSENPAPVIQPVPDGNFWIVQAGGTVDPKSCFTGCDWAPSGGESMKFTVEVDPAVLEHFTVDPDGTWTPQDPGGYDFNMKLSFANVSWSKSCTLYVARPDGTVPAGSYRSPGGSTLTLPGGLTEIGEEAFAGSPAEIVIISEGCTQIGSKAFAGMPNLKEITIPSTVNVIGDQIFGEGGSFAVYANSDAAVEAALACPGVLVLTE